MLIVPDAEIYTEENIVFLCFYLKPGRFPFCKLTKRNNGQSFIHTIHCPGQHIADFSHGSIKMQPIAIYIAGKSRYIKQILIHQCQFQCHCPFENNWRIHSGEFCNHSRHFQFDFSHSIASL